MVLPKGFEPSIFAVRGRCPRPLDDGSVSPKLYPGKAKAALGRSFRLFTENHEAPHGLERPLPG